MKSIYGVLLLAAYLCMSHAHSLSKDFERCKADDQPCIVRRTNELLRSYPEGFKELHLKEFDPLNIKTIHFAGNPNTPVNLDLTMSDLKIHGLSTMTVSKFEGFTKDPKDFKELNLEGVIPHPYINGKYKTTGKLLVVPITGEGDLNISMDKLQIKSQSKVVTQTRDGKTYFKVDKSKLKIKVDKIQIDAKNLFKGEKTLADATLKVLNDNWQVLWDEISPQIAEEISLNIDEIVEGFTNHFSLEELFLN